MNTSKPALLAGLLAAVLTHGATTQAASINERQAAQRESIRAGIEDGSLTRPEARRLRDSQVNMERKEQRFRSDGELSARERINLRHTADRNRARIYTQRRDEQVRPGAD